MKEENLTRVFGKRNRYLFHIDVGSCNGCDIEVYALSKFGYEFVDDPAMADVILICGSVTKQTKQLLEGVLDKTQKIPKVVVGTCAISGKVFGGEGCARAPVDKFTCVDVYVFGCPPQPKEIKNGILMALKQGGFNYS